jgi:hypothetical protein
MFSPEEIERYARHIVLCGIDGPGQQNVRDFIIRQRDFVVIDNADSRQRTPRAEFVPYHQRRQRHAVQILSSPPRKNCRLY